MCLKILNINFGFGFVVKFDNFGDLDFQINNHTIYY